MVVVPLAMAVPAVGDTVNFIYSTDPGDSFTSKSTSGGALPKGTVFGHVFGNSGTSITLTGDSKPPDLSGQYLPAELAVANFESLGLGGPGTFPGMVFQWAGSFQPGSFVDVLQALHIKYDLGLQGFSNAGASTIGKLYWQFELQIVDLQPDAGDPTLIVPVTLLDHKIPVPAEGPLEGLSYDFSDNETVLFSAPGTPMFWFADLTVLWDMPRTDTTDDHIAANPLDRLAITPSFTIESDGGGSSIPGGPTTPLPPTFALGGVFLLLAGAGYSMRRGAGGRLQPGI
jgi:hypothetical protein